MFMNLYSKVKSKIYQPSPKRRSLVSQTKAQMISKSVGKSSKSISTRYLMSSKCWTAKPSDILSNNQRNKPRSRNISKRWGKRKNKYENIIIIYFSFYVLICSLDSNPNYITIRLLILTKLAQYGERPFTYSFI